MFKITRDASHNLLEIRLAGFFEPAEAQTYVQDIAKAFVRHGMRGGYIMLIDCSECSLQSQQVLGVFAQHISTFPKARRIAVVTGSSLIRMQVKRIMTQSYLQTFERRSEAHAWLLENDAEIAA